MRTFVIERDIPGAGKLNRDELREAAATSNRALAQVGPQDIEWVHSYVADDKTFCIYRATDQAKIREHAELSGFPASKITEVRGVIDPATAGASAAVENRS